MIRSMFRPLPLQSSVSLAKLWHRFKRCFHLTSVCYNNPVRVRFAPSPTGQLHLGGLRTALYNYLFAKSHDGKFIIRMEDTDRTRLVPGATESLLSILDWAGIKADEGPTQGGDYGPYFQSERVDIYSQMIDRLLKNGTAYHCFCSERRLELLRKDSVRRGETPKYDNRCRHLSADEAQEKLDANMPYVIRFKLETYKDPWEDLVYGPIHYDVANIEGDPVLIKSDKFPTYHFANVVDDHLMKITHVLRGVEWQASTTKHILLYKAFGWKHPQFAHLPVLLNPDGSKLSKRQGDLHVQRFKDGEFFPDAVLNLVTFTGGGGFKVKDTRGLTLEELVQEFDISRLNTHSTKLETSYFSEINRTHLLHHLAGSRRASIISDLRSKVTAKYIDKSSSTELQTHTFSKERVERILDWALQERIHATSDLLKPEFEFLWRTPNKECLERLQQSDAVLDMVTWALEEMEKMSEETYERKNLLPHFKQLAKEKKLKFNVFMKTLRLALTGLEEGPSVGEILEMLGKETATRRLRHVVQCLQKDR